MLGAYPGPFHLWSQICCRFFAVETNLLQVESADMSTEKMEMYRISSDDNNYVKTI